MKTAELAASILQQHLPAAAVPIDAIQLSGELRQSITAQSVSVTVSVQAACGLFSTADTLTHACFVVRWRAGKLQTLSALLSGIIAEGCKVVVVSTSTTALDMIDNLLCTPNRCEPALRAAL